LAGNIHSVYTVLLAGIIYSVYTVLLAGNDQIYDYIQCIRFIRVYTRLYIQCVYTVPTSPTNTVSGPATNKPISSAVLIIRVGQDRIYTPCMTVHLVTSPKSTVYTPHIGKVGQNRIYTPYMTEYLVISQPKIPYKHRIYMVLANPTYRYVVLANPAYDSGHKEWFWPTLLMHHLWFWPCGMVLANPAYAPLMVLAMRYGSGQPCLCTTYGSGRAVWFWPTLLMHHLWFWPYSMVLANPAYVPLSSD